MLHPFVLATLKSNLGFAAWNIFSTVCNGKTDRKWSTVGIQLRNPVRFPQPGLVAHDSGILLNFSENRRIARAARYHWAGAEAAHSSTSSPDAVAYVTLLHRRPLQKARCSSFPRFPRQTSSSFLETSFRFHDVQSRPCSEGSGRGGAVFRQAEGGSAGPAVTGAGHVEAPPAASLLPFRALRG